MCAPTPNNTRSDPSLIWQAATLVEELSLEPQFIGGLFRKYSAAATQPSAASSNGSSEVLTLDGWLQFQKVEQQCTDEAVARSSFEGALRTMQAASARAAEGTAASAGVGAEGLHLAAFQELLLSDANSALDSAKLAYQEAQMEHP